MQSSFYFEGVKNYTKYIVKDGDSLYMIAKAYNVTVDELKSVNHLVTNTIYPNQILFIPTKSSGSTTNSQTYTTRSGDTIRDILNKFNITLEEMIKYNDIDKLKLEGNQLLYVGAKPRGNTYIVNINDSVEDILVKFNLSPIQLLMLNKDKLFSNGKEIIVSE